MNNKLLIIGVSVLIVISLAFGITVSKSFNFFSTQFVSLSKLANAVAEITGGDTDSYIPIYVPDLNNADLGTFYDEKTNQIILVQDIIKSMLPTWLRVADTDQVLVKVFPTFYSFNLNSCYSSINLNVDPNLTTDTSNNVLMKQRYSINRAIRLYVTVYDDYRNVSKNYDLYIFYDYKANDIAYFCTFDTDKVGIKSYLLNSYSQYWDDVYQYNDLISYPYLNSKYKVQLDPYNPEKDTLFNTYLYDNIENLLNTTDPLWLYMEDFINN